jgi:hypothetical protein
MILMSQLLILLPRPYHILVDIVTLHKMSWLFVTLI